MVGTADIVWCSAQQNLHEEVNYRLAKETFEKRNSKITLMAALARRFSKKVGMMERSS